ncbi:MAG: DegT/DnrJ/EryC1/StrS family aminotransferase [Thermodesulfobacteriota bacterium]|nr:DegT/DnrJ/EryC1/StrS family aminotransferase [Thermodesulfobacteriota bacterium]
MPSDILAGLKETLYGNKCLEGFKEDIRRYFGVRHCFLVSSGRAALTMLLKAMRQLSPDKDEVVLPAYTSFSVPSAVVKAGLKVSLCDIDPETMSPDIDSLKESLSDKTLCFVVCHLYGYPCDMDAILKMAGESGVFVIDDAAQAMGATYKGKALGTFGDAGIFSLSRGKNITTIDGGIIITDSEKIAAELSKLELKKAGFLDRLNLIFKAMIMSLLLRPHFYWIPQRLPFLKLGLSVFSTEFGLKEFTGVQAGIGRRMLRRLKQINEGRKKKAGGLMAGLSGCSGVKFPRQIAGAEPVFLRLPVRLNRIDDCGKAGLGIVRSYPYPLNEIDALRPHLVSDGRNFPGAKEFSRRVWTLPTHGYVQQEDMKNILEHYSLRSQV